MTEELPSETFSETQVASLVKQYQETMEMLRWNVAIVTVLLQEAGGLVEIDKATLEGIDVNNARTVVTYDEDREIYIVEGVFKNGPN